MTQAFLIISKYIQFPQENVSNIKQNFREIRQLKKLIDTSLNKKTLCNKYLSLKIHRNIYHLPQKVWWKMKSFTDDNKIKPTKYYNNFNIHLIHC